MKLSDLKAKATASELTLILAVEAAVRVDVVNEVQIKMSRAGEEFLKKNAPTTYSRLQEWATDLVRAMVKAAQPTDV